MRAGFWAIACVSLLSFACTDVSDGGGGGTNAGAEPVTTKTSPLNTFPVKVRISKVTIGRSFEGELEEFSLTNFSSEFFQCGPQASLSHLTFCNAGQTYVLPDDLPPSSIRNKQDETVTGFVGPGQTTAVVPIRISQRPPGTFVFGPITFNVNIDLTTRAVTTTQTGAPPIKKLTDTCVTNLLDWEFCWEIELPCDAASSLDCVTESPNAGCPPVTGRSTCAGPVPGPCVPDPVPPGQVCGASRYPLDLTPNLPTGQPSLTDENGLLWNPRWGWQVDGNQPPAPSPGELPFLTSQPTTHQDDIICTAAEVIGASSGGGHRNWVDATYTGRVRWDSHSPPGKDDDYNLSILPPLVEGTDFPAGIVHANSDQKWIQAEFDSDETVDLDPFNAVPWWREFHTMADQVDQNNRGLNHAFIDGHEAIITGLVGMDEAHDVKSELHPVHIIAIRQAAPEFVRLSDDAWSVFFRNWGNEGYCGPGQEYVGLTTMILRLPRPQGLPADADFTIGPGSVLRGGVAGWRGPGPPPNPNLPMALSRDPDNGDTLVTVTIGAPSDHTFVVGEIHLVWSPTGTAMAPPPEPLPAFVEEEFEGGPEARWGEMLDDLPAAQRSLFDAMYEGMVPRQAVQTVSIAIQKVSTPPAPPTVVPSNTQGSPSPRTELKKRARVDAVCTATRGNVPDMPGFCANASVGSAACIYGSDSVFIGDRVTVQTASGAPGGITNAGGGFTRIGPGAKVGTISSVAPVVVDPGAVVSGSITSAAGVTVRQGASVQGAVAQNQSLTLPPVGLNVTFPPGRRHDDVVVRHGRHVSLDPGVHGTVSVEPHGMLSLHSGTYYLDDLLVDPHAVVSLDSSAGGVVIYVKRWVAARGSFVERAGGEPTLFVGTFGPRAFIDTGFPGTVIAPNGAVVLQNDRPHIFSGAIMGKEVVVHHGVTIACPLL